MPFCGRTRGETKLRPLGSDDPGGMNEKIKYRATGYSLRSPIELDCQENRPEDHWPAVPSPTPHLQGVELMCSISGSRPLRRIAARARDIQGRKKGDPIVADDVEAPRRPRRRARKRSRQ